MLAGIISFQPMLTFINSSINVDPLLFLAFAVFILGSVRILRSKIDIWSMAFTLGGMILGILTKPPGYFMLVALFFLILLYFLLYYKNRVSIFSGKKIFLWLIPSSLLAIYVVYFILRSYFPNILKPLLLSPKYLLYELQYQVSLERSYSYWGSFGWVDTNLSRFFIYAIWFLSILAAIGIIKYLVRTFFLDSQAKTEKEKVFSFQLLYFLFFDIGVGLIYSQITGI